MQALYQSPLPIEALESRLFLSAAASASGLTAAQLQSLHNAARQELHHPASNPLTGVGSALVQLYQKNAAGDALTAQDFGATLSSNGRPGVSVHTHGNVAVLLKRLQKLGLTVIDVSAKLHVVDGYLPVAALPRAARLPHVTGIAALVKPTVNSVGVATDQGDLAMQANIARQTYGMDGTGISVGVISDSAGQVGNGLADSIATGDLPANTTILMDGDPSGTDEGRAMMEEIHDVAPGAQLFFYTGGNDQNSMATAVSALKAAGCKIIVDDLGFSDEPFFQEGVISKAINTFVQSGGSYFSAIGNDGKSGYLRTNIGYVGRTGATFVNLDPNGVTAAEKSSLAITVSSPISLTLQWDNPYNGFLGQASSEMDLLIYDSTGTRLITSSNDSNLVDGIPLQNVQLSAGSYRVEIQLAAMKQGAPLPDMIKLVGSEEGGNGITAFGYPGLLSSGFGHAVGQYTISVGAVPFSSAPPYSSVSPVRSETFSSTGPIINAFDLNGNKLQTPQTLQKPDISGIDGINTSFFGYHTATDPTTFPQFFGTSAAAPNVAAVAALMDQFHPGSTEAVINLALRSSATPLNGAAAGTWDSQGGYGLVNAVKAIAYFGTAPVAPKATFAAVSTPRTTPVAAETITFNEPVSGFDLSDLMLTRDGGTNLLTAAQTLTTTDNTTFTLTNLSTITAETGTYVLTLTATISGITGGGYALPADATITWQNGSGATLAPTVQLAAITSPRTTPVSSETINFNEAVTGVALSDLTLTRDGGANLLTSAQTVTSTNQISYTLANLSALTAAVGTYILTLNAAGSGIAGSGQALTAGASVTWTVTAGTHSVPHATIVGRHLFYNDSLFDGYSKGVSSLDDAAIATDKTALLPGHTATFANYSSYIRGINGIMIDVAGLPVSSLTAADFSFAMGNTNTTSTWAVAPNPSSIVVRPGAGVGGSSRIELVWPDYIAGVPSAAVLRKWLKVTVKADTHTGLATSDVFYFGSAPGESGNSAGDTLVNATDVANTQGHISTANAPISSDWDFDRSGKVDANDVKWAVNNQTPPNTVLQLIKI